MPESPAGFATMALLLERLLSAVEGLRSDLAAAKAAPAAAPEFEKLLDARGAAALLGMSESWIYQRVEASELPHVRLGHAIRFERSALLAYARGERGQQGRVVAFSQKTR